MRDSLPGADDRSRRRWLEIGVPLVALAIAALGARALGAGVSKIIGFVLLIGLPLAGLSIFWLDRRATNEAAALSEYEDAVRSTLERRAAPAGRVGLGVRAPAGIFDGDLGAHAVVGGTDQPPPAWDASVWESTVRESVARDSNAREASGWESNRSMSDTGRAAANGGGYSDHEIDDFWGTTTNPAAQNGASGDAHETAAAPFPESQPAESRPAESRPAELHADIAPEHRVPQVGDGAPIEIHADASDDALAQPMTGRSTTEPLNRTDDETTVQIQTGARFDAVFHAIFDDRVTPSASSADPPSLDAGGLSAGVVDARPHEPLFEPAGAADPVAFVLDADWLGTPATAPSIDVSMEFATDLAGPDAGAAGRTVDETTVDETAIDTPTARSADASGETGGPHDDEPATAPGWTTPALSTPSLIRRRNTMSPPADVPEPIAPAPLPIRARPAAQTHSGPAVITLAPSEHPALDDLANELNRFDTTVERRAELLEQLAVSTFALTTDALAARAHAAEAHRLRPSAGTATTLAFFHTRLGNHRPALELAEEAVQQSTKRALRANAHGLASIAARALGDGPRAARHEQAIRESGSYVHVMIAEEAIRQRQVRRARRSR